MSDCDGGIRAFLRKFFLLYKFFVQVSLACVMAVSQRDQFFVMKAITLGYEQLLSFVLSLRSGYCV